MKSSNYYKRDFKSACLQRVELLLAELKPDIAEAETRNKKTSINKQYEQEKPWHLLNSCHFQNNL